MPTTRGRHGRRPTAIAASLASLLLALPLLVACQPRRSSQSLTVANKSRIDSLDPVQASRIGVMQVLSGLGDPLYAIDSNGRLEPRLATALPELSGDGLRARIPLRRGVLFHDGTRFDAAAMAFSLRRFMAIGTLGYQLSERVESVQVTAPYEIELVLKRPFSPLPRLLSAIFLTPVSPTAYRRYRDKPLNDRFVGTGPYALAFFAGQQQRLTPWPRYWGQRPANAGIDLVTLSNSTALFGALRSGEVDLLLNSGLEIDHQQALHRDAAAGRLREAIGPSQEIALVSLLTDQPPLNRTVLRQAVARSLDRATIVQRVTLGLRSPQRQLIPPDLPGSDPGAWPAYDPAAARALYRRAGYCQGKLLTLPLTYRSDIPTDRLFALTWQAQLRRDLGDCVTLEVSGMEATTAYSQLDKGALTMLFYDWIGDYPDAENFLTPLLSCSKAEGDRCLKGNSVLGGSFWTAPGLESDLQLSSQLDGPGRVALLVAIQLRVAAASPYLPVWLSAPVAWGQPGISRPRFDGSGRVMLGELRRLPAATGAGRP
ncbi:ABC transporter substrate-binding protein [Cyanobium sp. AMD-g]|uniref:ABC transporter substrate-binding protein n=1 Tax=Cyanobium sp. AMD-g TaxID=2823699 RepID=UPI0020CC3077|nr:ABC transporter substrate-binding protein [Cyanobium sp. AMD-g]MCP9930031.1 ABC transporter substrate-binding protein [Cyanobium sp. AMD-g]